MQTWPYLSENLKKETRECFTEPANPQTKIVELSTGTRVKIRGLSMLELLQIGTKSVKKAPSENDGLKEAIERLRS